MGISEFSSFSYQGISASDGKGLTGALLEVDGTYLSEPRLSSQSDWSGTGGTSQPAAPMVDPQLSAHKLHFTFQLLSVPLDSRQGSEQGPQGGRRQLGGGGGYWMGGGMLLGAQDPGNFPVLLFHSKMASALEPLVSGCIFRLVVVSVSHGFGTFSSAARHDIPVKPDQLGLSDEEPREVEEERGFVSYRGAIGMKVISPGCSLGIRDSKQAEGKEEEAALRRRPGISSPYVPIVCQRPLQ
ncbi:unnamed protein product [Pleuronectes platessa]|uniref:Uncharacterized protein n=1 Tax=Pleuronectes platessa TaxID=8262 RepID=A0A9N7VDC2_PLEPL|nr:unnamed protein product [Pleuronectes platessa]